jgi:hypothetical protein
MNEQQTDELLALSVRPCPFLSSEKGGGRADSTTSASQAIFEDKVAWERTEEGEVEVKLNVEIDWEEEREVEVWDWEPEVAVAVAEPAAEVGLSEVVEGVKRLEVEDREVGRKDESVRGKSRKKPRRRGGGGRGPAPARATEPPPSSSPTAPPRNRPPPSSSTPRLPPPRPPPSAAVPPAPPPTPRTSSILTLSLTKTGVATPEGHKLVHLTPSPAQPLATNLPLTKEEEEEEERPRGPKRLWLRYLPPLELVVRLGEGYPEREAPRIRVWDQVGWLGEERVVELEKVLNGG